MTTSPHRQDQLDYLSQFDIAEFPNATYALEGSEFVFTAEEIMENQAQMVAMGEADYPTREEVRAMAEAELYAEYPF